MQLSNKVLFSNFSLEGDLLFGMEYSNMMFCFENIMFIFSGIEKGAVI